MVAPVALVGLDPVTRENFTRIEGGDRDLGLIDDRENTAAGVSDAGIEVMKPTGAPQGHDPLAVGDVIAKTEVAAAGF